MTTSGTNTFNLEIAEIIEQASSQINKEYSSGIDMSKARQKLNLILIEMNNEAIPLSNLEDLEIPLVKGVQKYILDSHINDILAASVYDSSCKNENKVSHISREDWYNISGKDIEGRPQSICTERNRDALTIKIHHLPNETDRYVLRMLCSTQIEDVTKSAVQTIDLNTRYLPAIVNILSYELSKTIADMPVEKRRELKRDANESWARVKGEDDERVSMVITPSVGGRNFLRF